MTRSAALAATALALALTGCGSKAEAPVEQIVVRQPGKEAAPAAPAAGGLVANGQAAFAACAACHSVEAGGHRASAPTCTAWLAAPPDRWPGSAIPRPWQNPASPGPRPNWEAFLANPAAKIPGTAMAAGQVGDAQRRAAIIAYLASLKT